MQRCANMSVCMPQFQVRCFPSAALYTHVPSLLHAGISPSDTNRDHTLSTLRYARRAMSIKNSLHRSVMGPAGELAYLKELVSQLQEENTQLKQVISDAGLQSALAAAAMPQKGLPGRAESVCELYVKAC